MKVVASKRKIGRPRGPRMPCGWGCGAALSATEMRPHFSVCWRRPERDAIVWGRCQCCDVVYEGRRADAPDALCRHCRSGTCRRCWRSWAAGRAKRKGRPAGPRMPCGWQCEAHLTARQLHRISQFVATGLLRSDIDDRSSNIWSASDRVVPAIAAAQSSPTPNPRCQRSKNFKLLEHAFSAVPKMISYWNTSVPAVLCDSN